MREVVIVDIDGVVADSRHRNHHLEVEHERDVDWRAWEQDIPFDTPIAPMVDLVDALRKAGKRIVFSTSRNSTCYEATFDWLHFNKVGQLGELVLMRRDGDIRPSAEVKREHVQGLRNAGWTPVLAIDDHSANVAMFREEGILTLHAADY